MIFDIRSDLLAMALQLPHNGKRAGYERLEFLGDRVLGLVVAELLYTMFPREKEGEMARRFVALTREETLAAIAEQMGLPEQLKTCEEHLRHNPSVLSDVCEAVIAALYLDKGLDSVKDMMKPLWLPFILAETSAPQDAKSALQEWSQRRYKTLPVYTLLGKTGPDHQPIFTISVSIGKKSAVGTGVSKKAAEQNAAENFMEEVVHGHK